MGSAFMWEQADVHIGGWALELSLSLCCFGVVLPLIMGATLAANLLFTWHQA